MSKLVTVGPNGELTVRVKDIQCVKLVGLYNSNGYVEMVIGLRGRKMKEYVRFISAESAKSDHEMVIKEMAR